MLTLIECDTVVVALFVVRDDADARISFYSQFGGALIQFRSCDAAQRRLFVALLFAQLVGIHSCFSISSCQILYKSQTQKKKEERQTLNA